MLFFPLTGSIPLLSVSFVLFFSAAAVSVGAAPSVIIEDHGGTFLKPASEYIELLCKVLPHAPRMSHIVTNVNIELDGDHACSECYFLPSHGGIRSKSF